MEDVRKMIVEVLEKGYLMSLATVDSAGPWVSDVGFSFDDDLNLYWASQTGVRHSQSLVDHPHVAAAIRLCNQHSDEKVGIQVQGLAEKVDKAPLIIAARYNGKRGRPAPADADDILHPGQSWYCLRPTKIDLIHQPLFGYEKKFLEL